MGLLLGGVPRRGEVNGMTRDREAKREVRARMRVTGERYTQARDALFGPSLPASLAPSRPDAGGGDMVDKQLLESLDRDGYAVVRGVVPKPTIDELRRWVDDQTNADLEWRRAEVRRRREAGEADVRAFPVGSEGWLGFDLDDDARTAPLVESVADIASAIGTPRRQNGAAAVCLPGWGGHSGLHQDLSGPAPELGRWDAVIFTWPLSAWEGMRLVPGSHRRDPIFQEAFSGAVAPHPDEVHVDAGPGDVVINSVHIWKSSLLNGSTERRSEIWLAFDNGPGTMNKILDYWAHTEISHGEAPRPEPGNYVRKDDQRPGAGDT